MSEQNDLPEVIKTDTGENEEFATSLDEELSKPLLTEIARKKHWREKSQKETELRQKLETELKNLKEQHDAQQQKPAVPPVAGNDDIEEVLRLRAEGISDSQILTLRQYAKRMGVPISEVMKDPIIKKGLEAEAAEKQVARATPAPSNKTFSVGQKQWSQMTEAERKANFSQLLENGVRKNNNE